MELAKVQEIALANQKSLTAFDEWAEGIDRRIAELEKEKTGMLEVQIALKELMMSIKFFETKLEDIKKSIDKINDENKTQHDALSDRIKKIEDAPADKWNKASWLITTTAIGAILGFIIKYLIP